jgi:hypothetical protein
MSPDWRFTHQLQNRSTARRPRTTTTATTHTTSTTLTVTLAFTAIGDQMLSTARHIRRPFRRQCGKRRLYLCHTRLSPDRMTRTGETPNGMWAMRSQPALLFSFPDTARLPLYRCFDVGIIHLHSVGEGAGVAGIASKCTKHIAFRAGLRNPSGIWNRAKRDRGRLQEPPTQAVGPSSSFSPTQLPRRRRVQPMGTTGSGKAKYRPRRNEGACRHFGPFTRPSTSISKTSKLFERQ